MINVKIWNSDLMVWETWSDLSKTRGYMVVGESGKTIYLSHVGCFDQACAYFDQGFTR